MTKKPTKKATPRKQKGDPTALDFDPVLCIEQYEELQRVGRHVCQALSKIQGTHEDYHYHGVCNPFSKEKEVHISHDCTWWAIPTRIMVQGVNGIIEFIQASYRAELDERQEAAIKEEQEREKDLREYQRLQKKIFGQETK